MYSICEGSCHGVVSRRAESEVVAVMPTRKPNHGSNNHHSHVLKFSASSSDLQETYR